MLAAINEIETDYGRNLSVSSAGALGWMQFMPPSWAMYGVDANGDGVKYPYNPVDAIFAAARYLKAAGADTDLSRAIFAYNHADWYVESVLLRARVIGGMPADLVGSLTGLTQGHFPVAARATYADGLDAKAATRRVEGTNAAVPVEGDPTRRSINVFARAGAPVIAVNDGRVVKLGENARLGRFVVLQDVYGNRYTYSHLGSVASKYPVPKPHAQNATAHNELELPKDDAKPTVPATSGTQKPADKASGSGDSGKQRVAANAPDAGATAADAPVAATKERLFAHPERPAAYAAGGQRQLAELGQPLESFDGYFTQALALDPHDYLLKPLQRGSSVIAGTILGRIGKTDPALAPHVEFAIRPAGRGAPQIDPKPILDGWKLLESTAIYRAKGKNAFAAANASGPSIGQIMLMSKEQLQRSVLADPRLEIYECGRQDIATGAIDRRVLATLEFLSASGFRLTVTALEVRPRLLHDLGQRLGALERQRGRHRRGERHPDRRPPGLRLDHGHHDPAAADAARHDEAAPDHQPHDLPGDRQHARAAGSRRPHPRRLPSGRRPARRSAAAGDPQAAAVDEARRAARLDREPGRPDAHLEVRDQGRPRRRRARRARRCDGGARIPLRAVRVPVGARSC